MYDPSQHAEEGLFSNDIQAQYEGILEIEEEGNIENLDAEIQAEGVYLGWGLETLKIRNWKGKEIVHSSAFGSSNKRAFETKETFEGKDRLIQEEIQKYKQLSESDRIIVSDEILRHSFGFEKNRLKAFYRRYSDWFLE